MNIQFAIQGGVVHVLEVNPRASRTVPFVSKAIGAPLAKIAARVMAGKTLHEIGFTKEIIPTHISVKEAVFPFIKFPGVDTVLGPEMKSTGGQGVDTSFLGVCQSKSLLEPCFRPEGGIVECRDADKTATLPIALAGREWVSLIATHGTRIF
jgi:carbamoyl-phosphate synthase large subunit